MAEGEKKIQKQKLNLENNQADGAANNFQTAADILLQTAMEMGYNDGAVR